MSDRTRVLFWVGLFAAVLTLLVLVQSILLPFIVGILVAYFLDPVADRLETSGFSRTKATLLITGLFFSVVIIGGLFLLPLFVRQIVSLVNSLPGYVENVRHFVEPHLQPLLERYDLESNLEELSNNKQEASAYLFQGAGRLLKGMFESGVALVNLLSLIFISPIVSFYMLRDWDKIVEKIYAWLPRRHAGTVKRLILEMDKNLSGYVHGYTNICLMLGLFYGTGLFLVGLDYGFTVGFLTGMLSFIPFVGVAIGMTVGVLICVFQFGFDYHLGLTVGVFLVGQVAEGNFITPRIIGDKIGLHPVWIMFSLLAGGALFGFTGVLIAVPAAAMLAVLVRFAVEQYLKSSLYHGKGKKEKAARKPLKAGA